MQGLLNILKPPGMTSHDVVAAIRRKLGIRRVGHGGTLDPLAAGLLILLIGKGTRLSEFVTKMDKVYRGEITFGIRTDTQDTGGRILDSRPVHLERHRIETALRRFTGCQQQVPPMVSALKQGGERLYKLARKGRIVSRSPRAVDIKRLALLDFYPEEGGYPRAFFECHCSKGTYMRTLAADIGDYLGCGAHLSFLLRTAVGPFQIGESWLLEEIAGLSDLSACLLPLSRALGELPRVLVKPAYVAAIAHGGALYPSGIAGVPPSLISGQLARLEQPPDNLLALAVWTGDTAGHYFRPYKVFHEL